MNFLNSGGTVLLADDSGSGNSLLQDLNVSARFASKEISDLYFYSRQPTYPLIYNFVPNAITLDLRTVLMNQPSYLEVSNNRTVSELAFSSPLSFVDNYRNGTISAGEATQPYPVIASIRLGAGLLVLVSNANAFANQSITLFNNTLLFRNLLNLAGGGLTFDVAHLSRAPLSDFQAAFKADVDSVTLALSSTAVRTAVTLALIAGFSLAFVWQSRTRRAQSHSPESSIRS